MHGHAEAEGVAVREVSTAGTQHMRRAVAAANAVESLEPIERLGDLARRARAVFEGDMRCGGRDRTRKLTAVTLSRMILMVSTEV
jgi:hypothetical protein